MAVIQTLHWLTFTAFVAIKVGGTALATWSWLWLLMPAAPVFALAFSHMGWL